MSFYMSPVVKLPAMCRHFLAGDCKKGTGCELLHESSGSLPIDEPPWRPRRWNNDAPKKTRRSRHHRESPIELQERDESLHEPPIEPQESNENRRGSPAKSESIKQDEDHHNSPTDLQELEENCHKPPTELQELKEIHHKPLNELRGPSEEPLAGSQEPNGNHRQPPAEIRKQLTKEPQKRSGGNRNNSSSTSWRRSGANHDGASSKSWRQNDKGRNGASNRSWGRADGSEPELPTESSRSSSTSARGSQSKSDGWISNNDSPRSEFLRGDGWSKVADWTIRLTGTKQNPGQMRSLWGEAFYILERLDHDLTRSVVDRLVARNNIGRLYVEQVVNHDHPGNTDYLANSIPFLLFITHPEIIDSLSIDRQVGTLYNYLYGTNGVKAVRFFRNLAEQLSDESSTANRTSGAWSSVLLEGQSSFSKALASIAECLRQTLRRNQNAGFNEDFKTVAETFCTLADLIPVYDKFYTSIDTPLREIVGIHRQANFTIERPVVPSTSIYTHDQQAVSSFPPEVDFPGYLSGGGARHDNDFPSIREIQLLPTFDEIKSERMDYLPFKDFSQPHFLQGVDRLLDTHFRLLRHDSILAIKETVRTVFGLLKLPKNEISEAFDSATRRTIQSLLYLDTRVTRARFDRTRGLEIGLSFLQPPPVINKSAEEQKKWWQEQKRFSRNCLACLVTSSEEFSRVTFLINCSKEINPRAKDGLANGNYGTIYVQLAEPTKQDEAIEFLLRQLSTPSKPVTQVLLEFPGILPAFLPVLQNLQNLSQSGILPLSRWIAPTFEDIVPGSKATTNQMNNPPPAYSLIENFSWDLKPILTDSSAEYFLPPTAQPGDSQILDDLETLTMLDRSQCKALITGLTKEMTLIQGPPGTGKSYVGVQLVRVLLHNKTSTKIGPIVCVCNTNHALDQFLENLTQEGIGKIVRIGGQSKSEQLKGKNLHTVSRAEQRTYEEKLEIRTRNEKLDFIEQDARGLCVELSKPPDSWGAIEDTLGKEFPTLYSQFDIPPTEDFEQVDGPEEVWDRWRSDDSGFTPTIQTQNERSIDAISICDNVWSLSKTERAQFIKHLCERVEAASRLTTRLAVLTDGHGKEILGLSAQTSEVERRCLSKADVIGITTTGLAGRASVLKRLITKVVICEEAGEVLEGHLINAILPTCQHLIQIGDHEQLRPQAKMYELSLESDQGKLFRLDESMFERLVNGKTLSPAQLCVQRRMRPEISALIKNTLYPELQDHALTKAYPNVVGMKKNVFWLDHTYPEAGIDGSLSRSRSNDWEVQMTHALARHLVLQGHYGCKDIAVLTPYTRQLQKLRQELRTSFEVLLCGRDEEALAQENFTDEEAEELNPNKVAFKKTNLMDVLRVATIDNFQGEEAKIVIISLVRSNPKRKIGFLKTTNRINVLLSRAKHGMYIIGSSETASSIPMWRDVCLMLHDAKAIGRVLSLVCPNHPEKIIQVEEPEDFLRLSPKGGCDLACSKGLDRCGHRCFSKCHSDKVHKATICAQPCSLLHPICQHPCQKSCGDNCGRCMVLVPNFLLPCGHIQEVIECWRTRSMEIIRCKKLTKVTPKCGHVVEEECWVDVSSAGYKCPKTCSSGLACGHSCSRTCGTCFIVADGEKRVDHGFCRKLCDRGFTACKHICRKDCHGETPCGLCDKRCQVKCEHSECSKACSEACNPCSQSCVWECEHQKRCLMPCSAPCERLPCDERCDRELRCGHRCPSVCGESCPRVEFCQICCTEERRKVVGADKFGNSPYNLIDLDESPILVLPCGHFYTRQTLDEYLGLHKAYSTDTQGNYTEFADLGGNLDEPTPKCPACLQPVPQHSIRRYGRLINRAAITEMTRRFLTSTFGKYKGLADTLSRAEQTIYRSRGEFFAEISSLGLSSRNRKKSKEILERRFKQLAKISREISEFVDNVRTQQQPANKVYQMTVIQKSSLKPPQAPAGATLYFRPDLRMETLARLLRIRSTTLQVVDISLLAHHLSSMDKAAKRMDWTVFIEDIYILLKLRENARGAIRACKRLIDSAKNQDLPGAEVEALGLFAKLTAIWQQFLREPKSSPDALGRIVEEAMDGLDRAEKLCGIELLGVDDLKRVVENAREQLCSSATFHQRASREELKLAAHAMKAKLSVPWAITGHWPYCQNEKFFKVDQCDCPVKEAACLDCGAPVCNKDHTSAAGVQNTDAVRAIPKQAEPS